MRSTSTISALALACIFCLPAHAQSAKTRDEVQRELTEAIRNGDMLAPGESGLTLRELHPGRYPGQAVPAAKTREQVRAELAEAVRTGDVVANGESGLTLREQFPQRYPAPVHVAGKTREEVKAELAEAIRDGNVLANGDSGLKLNELHPQWFAKTRGSEAVRQAEVSPGKSAQ
jgi:predicted RNase H-like HicB family nuclease